MSVITKADGEREPVKQAIASRKLIDDTIAHAREELTSIPQKKIAFEQERASLYKERRKKLEDQFTDIDEKIKSSISSHDKAWESLKKAELPTAFDKQLKELRQQCDDAIALKIAYINELEQEVVRRDHEYVNKTAENSQQIDLFVHQMRSLQSDLRQKINQELEKVSSVYDNEKNALAIQIEKEVKQLSAKRQEREQQLMKEIEQTARDHRDSLEALRQKNAEEYMIYKTTTESELQAQQKQYEDAVAQYHSSLEQLDYDFRVLQENDGEHEEKKKMQVKKLLKQRDTIRGLRKRYNLLEEKYKKENAQITDEYRRILQNYRELQLRFRNVAYTDFNNFREVWNLNEARLHQLVLKVLEANRVVNQQELGKAIPEPNPALLKRWIIGTDELEDLTKTPQAPAVQTTDGDGTTPIPTKKVQKPPNFISGKTLSEPLEHLWRLVSDEVGFLVDDRVKDLIGLSQDEDIETSKSEIRIDVLLQDLGISSKDDIEQLMSHFIRDTEFGELETPGFVRPHEVLEGLRRFVETYHPTVQSTQNNYFAQISQDATQNTSSEVARAILQMQGRMKRELEQQMKFLEIKGDVVSEEMWRLWNATYKGMQRYVSELEQRAKLIEETNALRNQNDELERILSSYLQSNANEDLIYAPMETVDFQTE